MKYLNENDEVNLTSLKLQEIAAQKIIAVFIWGSIWDALWLPAEMLTKEQIKQKYWYLNYFAESMLNYFFARQWFNKPWSGHISDDTLLTMATIDSLVENNKIDLNDIWRKSVKYYESQPQWFGKATIQAFDKIKQWISYKESWTIWWSGNGIMMKQSPLAIYFLLKKVP